MGKDLHTLVAYSYKRTIGLGKETITIAVYDPNDRYRCHALPFGGRTVCDCHTTLVVELSDIRQQQGYGKAEVSYGSYTNIKYVSASKDESKTEQAAGIVNPGGLLVSLQSYGEAELHLFDSLDRHTGPDGSGGIEKEIPESEYQLDPDGAQHVAIHNETGESFTIEILGVASGRFNLGVTEVTGTLPSETARAYRTVMLEEGGRATLETGAGSDHALRVDSDDDGVFETQVMPSAIYVDSDSDGLPDWWETAFGTQVAVADTSGDPDGDDVTNFREYRDGTDPLNPDTDGDGVADGADACPGHDDTLDGDGDGIPDGCDRAPVISDVEVYVSHHRATTATLMWDTDREADSFVRLGTRSGVYPERWEDADLETVHLIELADLDPDQVYYYRVGGTDIGGNTAESSEYTFTTSYGPPQRAIYLPLVLRNS
jgi:hypothetical protein